MKYNKFLEDLELIDSDHKNFSIETPLRDDAFEINDDEKIKIIEKNVGEILHTLGMDMTDDSLKGTPLRVAKAYVKELFGGLNPKNLPKGSTFENKYKYEEMLVEKNITVFSTCEHHLLPIYGKAHVAYFSNGNVIGLSKMNRIVDYYARRPQVQERLNIQIVKLLQEFLITEDSLLERSQIIHYFKKQGISELALPKSIKPVEKLPLLGTGTVSYTHLTLPTSDLV